MKIKRLVLFTAMSGLILSVHAEEAKWEWDFDHKMHFMVTPLSNKQFMLTVDTNKLSTTDMSSSGKKGKEKRNKNKKAFDKGAALLLRKSLSLCKGYNYQLKIIKGVSGVNDYKDRPNYIEGDLKAKLICA